MLDWLARLKAGDRGAPASRGPKKIAYSLFTPPDLSRNTHFVFDKYLLGVYFNARMNSLLYPDWQTVVYVDNRLLAQHRAYFHDLTDLDLDILFIGTEGGRPIWELVLS